MSKPRRNSQFNQWLGMIGMFGGLLWGILWTLQTFVHGPTQAGRGSGIYGPFLFLPWFFFVLSWLGVSSQGRNRFSLLAWIGYGVTLIALSLRGVGLFLVEVLGISEAYIPVFVLGLLGSGIGMVLFGVFVMRSRFWPIWYGVLLVVMGLTPYLLALSWPIRGMNPGVVIGYASLLAPEILFSIGWLLIGYVIGFGNYSSISSNSRSLDA